MQQIPVFIFCSGKATRLRPLSYFVPKPLLPWTKDRKSMLELNIQRLANLGYRKFYITFGTRKRLFEKIIKKYSNDLDISLIYESKPVGQIKSIKNLGKELNNFKYIICQHGDTFSDFDLNILIEPVEEEKDIACTIASSQKMTNIPKNLICKPDGRVVGINTKLRQKMFYKQKNDVILCNSMGTFVLNSKSIQAIKDDNFIGFFGDNDLLDQLAEKNLYTKCVDVKCKKFFTFNNLKELINIKGERVNV